MPTDGQSVAFGDLKSCSFLSSGSGHIICATHDDPTVFGLHGFGAPSSACEQRKQWLEQPCGSGASISHLSRLWQPEDYRLVGLLKRKALPAWLQVNIVKHTNDAWVEMKISERPDLTPAVRAELERAPAQRLLGIIDPWEHVAEEESPYVQFGV